MKLHAFEKWGMSVAIIALFSASAWPALDIEFGSIIGVGKRASVISSGDINGDGFVDLIVANIFSDSLSLLYNDGEGNFTLVDEVVLEQGLQHPVAVGVGDLDGDGRDDMAAVQVQNFGLAGQINPFNTSAMVIIFSNADGTFSQQSVNMRGIPSSVIVTDVDSDGRNDIVAGNNGEFSFDLVGSGAIIQIDTGIDILINQGNRNFAAAPQEIEIDGSVVDEVAFDYNGDGMADIIGANQGMPAIDPILLSLTVENPNVSIFRGTPNGVQPFTTIPLAYLPWDISTADFNGDGTADFAVSLVGQSAQDNFLSFLGRGATVEIYEGNGTGFDHALSLPVTGIAYAVLPEDFDLDGDIDLLVTVQEVAQQNGSNVLIPKLRLLENIDGAYTEVGTLDVEEEPRTAVAEDFDGDGDLDVAILCELLDTADAAAAVTGRVYVFYNQANQVTSGLDDWEMLK